MDKESNFDSDTSESWSLIDITEPVTEITEGIDETVISEQSVTTCHKEEPQNALEAVTAENVADDASFNDHSKGQQDFQVLYKGKVFENDCDLEKKSSEFSCGGKTGLSDADADAENKDLDNDTDGISIISESECNDFKLTAYETDEVWDEKVPESDLTEKAQPNVLRRKRKRLKLNYRESSEESVASDFMVHGENYYPGIENIDLRSDELQVKEYHSNPVYKHYRNNVANTMLSVAMGVIFTGVACIAIGHFLGVHDAQQTAGEMMQTLKRLQMENVLLHTRLAQLSRAFFSRGGSKVEIRDKNEPRCLDKYTDSRQTAYDINKNNLMEDELKNTVLFRGRSIDVPTKLNEPVGTLTYSDVRKGSEFPVSREVHDQVKTLNITEYEENDSKAPYVVNSDCIPKEEKFESRDPRIQNCLAVREKDLNRFRWFLLKQKLKTSDIKAEGPKNDNENELLCKFPQREDYYGENTEESYNSDRVARERNELGFASNNGNVDYLYLRNSTDYGNGSEEIKNKKKSSNFKKTKNRDEGVRTGKSYSNDWENSPKKRKKLRKKSPDMSEQADKYSKGVKNRKSDSSQKNTKTKECTEKDDGKCGANSRRRMESKKYKMDTENRSKYEAKLRDLKRDLFAHVNKIKIGPRSRKSRAQSITASLRSANRSECEECAGKSGNWFYRWAKGRERCRRDQKIRDWQFERAKSRADSRTGDAFWQFSRALGRESSRMHPYIRKKNLKYSFRKGFSSDAYSWI